MQSDGKIILDGYTCSSYMPPTSCNFHVMRYNADGSLDSSFGTGGKVTTSFSPSNSMLQKVFVQSDGKILATGITGFMSSAPHIALARYDSNGTLDSSFGTGTAGQTTSPKFGLDWLSANGSLE